MPPSPTGHLPVMPREVLDWLDPQPGQTFVDGTSGGGGHTALLAARVGAGGKVIALDRDPAAIERITELQPSPPVIPFLANYRYVVDVLERLGLPAVDGILLDLGLSSDQLADADRGFSFSAEGEFDLRFNPDIGEPAWQLANRLPERELADVIFRFGDERFSRRIARRIVAARRQKTLRAASEFAEIIRSCVPARRGQRIDAATRTFQALRIAVNDELGALAELLDAAPQCLRAGGRLAVISFHSLEDRLVKQAFRDDNRYMILTKKPIRPNQSEVEQNPRSRSARLRVAIHSREETAVP